MTNGKIRNSPRPLFENPRPRPKHTRLRHRNKWNINETSTPRCSQIRPLGVRTDDGIILTGSGSIAFVYSWSWLIGTLVMKAKAALQASQCAKSISNETFGRVLSFLYPFPFIYALTGWEKFHKIVHAWKRHANISE